MGKAVVLEAVVLEAVEVGEGEGVGSGCWIEREGRESLQSEVSRGSFRGEEEGMEAGYLSTFRDTE